MATATKKKPASAEKKAVEAAEEAEKVLDEQIEQLEGSSLEDVPISVERTLKVGDQEKEIILVQHEMPFLNKLKFFRLLSGTIRLAGEGEDKSVADVLGEIFDPISQAIAQGGVSAQEAQQLAAGQFIETVLKLIELAPDFAESLYVYALNVKPKDEALVRAAIQEMDDDQAMDILDAFIAQNGKAIRRFFDRHLQKVGRRLAATMEIQADTEPESETIT